MTRDLLWRGMLAGILAALLATLFARAVAEPPVDRAIAYETAHDARTPGHAADDGPEPVSRATQKGAGLLTAMTLYGAAVGGLFAIVFAFGYGRIARIGPRGFAAVLALAAFVIVGLVPALKYPPNPPAVGAHATVALRTEAYFAMLAISIVAAAIALRIRSATRSGLGAFNAVLAGIAGYLIVVALLQTRLPAIDEVPADFPASTLWSFRLAALGIQALLWSIIGLAFGAMAERVVRRAG